MQHARQRLTHRFSAAVSLTITSLLLASSTVGIGGGVGSGSHRECAGVAGGRSGLAHPAGVAPPVAVLQLTLVVVRMR